MKKKSYLLIVVSSAISYHLITHRLGLDNVFPFSRNFLIDNKYYGSKRKDIIEMSIRANNLVDSIIAAESFSKESSSKSDMDNVKSLQLRNLLSREYKNIADAIDSVVNGSGAIVSSNIAIVSPTQSIVDSLREMSQRVKSLKYGVYKIHPQDIYLRRGEVTREDAIDQMPLGVRARIRSLSENLKLQTKRKESSQAAASIQEIGTIFIEQSKVIAIKSPSFVNVTKQTGDYLIVLADDVKNDPNKIPDSIGF